MSPSKDGDDAEHDHGQHGDHQECQQGDEYGAEWRVPVTLQPFPNKNDIIFSMKYCPIQSQLRLPGAQPTPMADGSLYDRRRRETVLVASGARLPGDLVLPAGITSCASRRGRPMAGGSGGAWRGRGGARLARRPSCTVSHHTEIRSGASHRPEAGVVMAETAVVSQELPTGPAARRSHGRNPVVSQEEEGCWGSGGSVERRFSVSGNPSLLHHGGE